MRRAGHCNGSKVGRIEAKELKILPDKMRSLETDCIETNQLAIKRADVALFKKSYLTTLNELDCSVDAQTCSKVKHIFSPNWKPDNPNKNQFILRTLFVTGIDPNRQLHFLFLYDKPIATHGTSLLFSKNQLQEVRFEKVFND